MHNLDQVKATEQTIGPGNPDKPRWRGVSHQYAFFFSLVSGVTLLGLTVSKYGASGQMLKPMLSVLVFVISVSLLFGTSALYHRVHWGKEARALMRRFDHSSIYLLISGTYTPVMLGTLDGPTATIVLSIVWGASILGIAMELMVRRAPKWLKASMYVALGWVGVAVTPQIYRAAGPLILGMIALGGVLYTCGALVYARKKPNPNPKVFGYHEIFHMFVIAGVVVHYAVVVMLLHLA